MLKKLTIISILALASMQASAGSTIFPNLFNYQNISMTKVGEGTHTYLFGDAYHIALWAPKGSYSPYATHALQIQLRINPPKDMLRDAVAKELKKMGVAKTQVARWMSELKKIFPMQAKKGDMVAVITVPGKYIDVYYNNQHQGRLKDQELTRYFSNIWLRRDSVNPELARRLTGASL